MTTAKTKIGALLAVLCVFGLVLSPSVALADDRGGDESRSEASMTITVECNSVEVTSSKDISNVKVFFVDGTSEEINVNQPSFSRTFGKTIDHATAKSGETQVSDGTGACSTQPLNPPQDDDDDDVGDRGDKDDDRDDKDDDVEGRRDENKGAPSRGGNLSCPSGTLTFTINGNPGNGTFSDGTLSVTITNSNENSFSWSSNRTLHSVMIKGGPATKVNSGGTSGSATSAFNPDSGKLYGISHVVFCYTPDQVNDGGQPTPPCDADATMPGIQPCGVSPTFELCPAGTDNAGFPMTDIKDCNKDDVLGRVDTVNPVEVCPSGPYKGMPMTSPRDCADAVASAGDSVLPRFIVNSAQAVRGATRRAAGAVGAVLPFTGAGDALLLVGAALALIGSGTLTLRARRND